jgi:excisionase family DNA binding protein
MTASAHSLQLLTVDQLADQLQVRNRKVYDLIHNEGLPHVRLGRFYRFMPSQVEAWLRRRAESIPPPEATCCEPALPSYNWSRRRS